MAVPQRGGRPESISRYLVLVLVFCAQFPLPGTAATRLVPSQYPTIQEGIDASAAGDTVLIAPGTYRGYGNRNIEFRGRDIVVKSSHGPELTIIDAEFSGRGFNIYDSWETRAARIEGLTIQHGLALIGGGIFCSLSNPTIVGCRILDCRAPDGDGGGLGLRVFDGVVRDCVIAGCYAERGGGIWFEWSGFGASGAEFSDCVISGNRATDSGGGICFGGPEDRYELYGCTVAANECLWRGGGILAWNPLLLERCIVRSNCAEATQGPEMSCGNAEIRCCDVNVAGVRALGVITYDPDCIDQDPMFCEPVPCDCTIGGDWHLRAGSPCLPEFSPCGELIGALGLGCGSPTRVASTTMGQLKLMFRSK